MKSSKRIKLFVKRFLAPFVATGSSVCGERDVASYVSTTALFSAKLDYIESVEV
jgi:hypothetical protein